MLVYFYAMLSFVMPYYSCTFVCKLYIELPNVKWNELECFLCVFDIYSVQPVLTGHKAILQG